MDHQQSWAMKQLTKSETQGGGHRVGGFPKAS